MELIIAILILLLVLVFIWNVSSKDGDRAISCFFTIMISVLLSLVIVYHTFKYIPTAFDVYKNKTTLENLNIY